MKKLNLIVSAFVISILCFTDTHLALAQSSPTVETLGVNPEKNSGSNKQTIKINTLSLLLGTGSVFYERKLADNRSVQFGTAFLQYKFDETTFTGLILTPEYRFYIRNNALSGPYLAPYGRFQNFTLKSGGGKGTYRNIGGGFLIGRQWITKSDFTMDLFFGGHYGNGKISVDSGDEEEFETEQFEGFRPRVGFAIGFSF